MFRGPPGAALALASGFRYDFENEPNPTDREPVMPGFEAMFNAFVTLLVTVDPPGLATYAAFALYDGAGGLANERWLDSYTPLELVGGNAGAFIDYLQGERGWGNGRFRWKTQFYLNQTVFWRIFKRIGQQII